MPSATSRERAEEKVTWRPPKIETADTFVTTPWLSSRISVAKIFWSMASEGGLRSVSVSAIGTTVLYESTREEIGIWVYKTWSEAKFCLIYGPCELQVRILCHRLRTHAHKTEV